MPMRDVPRELRRIGCQLCRLAADWLSGRRRVLVKPNAATVRPGATFPSQLRLVQRILPTDYVEAKIHNIEVARTAIENLPVPPGGVLSFWCIVGRPSAARGFRLGRSLLGGQLRPDYGGGLCQLSGLLYYLCLQAGLEILERHPHSRDIYDDATRYAPLGSDATVAYGFKDLRVLNTLQAPICFRITATPDRVIGHLCSPAPIRPWAVEFVQTSHAGASCTVETRRCRPNENQFHVVNAGTYRRME
jgi:vancomycin resistance protein VanW